MEALLMEHESRRKRQKLSDGSNGGKLSSEDAQATKEKEVGITEFVSPDLPGFSGIIKKRYTDFLVNEIVPSGQVLHLQTTKLPASLTAESQPGKPQRSADPRTDTAVSTPSKSTGENDVSATEKDGNKEEALAANDFEIAEEDQKLLEEYLGSEIAQKVIKLYRRTLAKPNVKAGELGRINSEPVHEKDQRTIIHQTLRRIFGGRIESATKNNNSLLISGVPLRRLQAQMKGGKPNNRRGKLGWSEVGGEFLHFTIYKENKDTMEVMNFLARQMKIGWKAFKFAGTKDRRGVTVQRACAFRADANRLANMNRMLRNAVVGDFEYQKHGIELGDLSGNEFVITLRDCKFPLDLGDDPVSKTSELVSAAMQNIREKGYFNYFGLQRFGTFATRTDTIGLQMLQSDFKAACNSILNYSAECLVPALDLEPDAALYSSDDKARAEAIEIFETTGQANLALAKMPRKYNAESIVIKHLGKTKNDYMGALQQIPRNLRLMYVHAYQSLVWNHAVGERWRLYGDKVVEGDLVLINDFKEPNSEPTITEEVDADGDAIILPDTGDSSISPNDAIERARVLDSEEAASGKYSIFDVVLPLPGYDVLYPANKVTDFYKSFMDSAEGGYLDPFDMRRSWKEISLAGGYRKILSRPSPDYSFEVKKYTDENKQFVKTDLERLREQEGGPSQTSKETVDDAQEGNAEAKREKLAVVIKFQLGASQYATMALRELMKTGGVKVYQPEYMGGQ